MIRRPHGFGKLGTVVFLVFQHKWIKITLSLYVLSCDEYVTCMKSTLQEDKHG